MPAPAARNGDDTPHAHHLESTSRDVLDRIASPLADLVVWKRALPAALKTWLDHEDPGHLPQGRILVRLRHLRAGVGHIVGGTEKTRAARRLLADDIVALSERFAAIAGTDQVDIRLEVIQRDACWRFHRDAATLRLLTTYRGPGTQIPPPGLAAAALRAQRDYRGPLRELPLHSVAIFKGDPDNSGRGVLHRSPPVAGTGITRLLLCLNLPSGASPRPWRHGSRG